MAEVLKITGLTAGYGRLRVLHEIDFKVAEGERVGLVGLNSHGKTTLFRAISSRLGWQSGSILLDGAGAADACHLAPTPQGDARLYLIDEPSLGLARKISASVI